MTTSTPDTSAAARRCPLCGQANDCAPAQCGSFDVDCWCRHASFPAELPTATKGGNRYCLCRSCAERAARQQQQQSEQ